MENLSFQYPSWYILLCAFLGLAYAVFLYYRDKTFREQSKVLNAVLGTIRFLAVTFLAILLLSPLLKSLLTDVKKPVVVLAQDQSESIISEMNDSEKTAYQQSFESLAEALEPDYDLKRYSFGNGVREGIDFDFKDKVSNLSELLQNLYDLYSNQNLGAIIMATDGIYNEGSNPIYAGTKLAAPIYTVAMGDTTPQKDLIIKRVFHNKIAYLGDKFSVQADVLAQNCEGSSSMLRVSKVDGNNTNELQKVPIKVDKKDFFTTVEIILDANISGVQRYRIAIDPIPGEVSKANNVKDIFVDILDARQKILLLANSPHPDITALKQSLSNNKNYEVSSAFIDKLGLNVAEFDFVVLHQLPSKENSAASVLKILNEKKIPRLFIVGTQTNLNQFNSAQSIITITGDGRNTNDVQATLPGNFSLFTINENIPQNLQKFAPLLAPFGEFIESGNSQILLYQRIGKIDTKYPLLLFGEQDELKTGVLCAEGIWKWRLFDYLQNQNHELFNELMGKSIQFLTLKEDKRKFRVSVSKNIFNENESIIFDAELYNQSYELINEPDASLVITNSEGKDFSFTFNKIGKAYTLDAGYFPVGNYKFRANVFSDGEQLSYSGQFSVQPIQLEVFETTADHGLLRLLSEKYGGAVGISQSTGPIARNTERNRLGQTHHVSDFQDPLGYQSQMDLLSVDGLIESGVVPEKVFWSLLIGVISER